MKRIIYTQENGVLAVVIPAQEYIDECLSLEDEEGKKVYSSVDEVMNVILNKNVPKNVTTEIVDETDIPTDRTFREAWEHDTSTSPQKVKTNLTKAKVTAHEKRRFVRDELFTPLDIEATIPSKATQAEQARQVIRERDDTFQVEIDNAINVDSLKVIMNNIK